MSEAKRNRKRVNITISDSTIKLLKRKSKKKNKPVSRIIEDLIIKEYKPGENFFVGWKPKKEIKSIDLNTIDPRLKEMAKKVDHSLDDVIPSDKIEKMVKNKEKNC